MTRFLFTCSIFMIALVFSYRVDSQPLTHSDKTIVYIAAPPPYESKRIYSRRFYESALLDLALSKTLHEHGDYEIRYTKNYLKDNQALKTLQQHTLKNYIHTFTVSDKTLNDERVNHVKFPIMRGIFGYRLCAIKPEAASRTKLIENVDDLKQFSFVQGARWPDTKILRQAGFTVYTARNIKVMMNMVSRDRADLHCRGIVEIKTMLENKLIHDLGLILDKHFVLYYPVHRYFYMNKNDGAIVSRIQRGLNLALEDGSFVALWEKYHLDAVNFVELDGRRLLSLDNKTVSSVDNFVEQNVFMHNLIRNALN